MFNLRRLVGAPFLTATARVSWHDFNDVLVCATVLTREILVLALLAD